MTKQIGTSSLTDLGWILDYDRKKLEFLRADSNVFLQGHKFVSYFSTHDLSSRHYVLAVVSGSLKFPMQKVIAMID